MMNVGILAKECPYFYIRAFLTGMHEEQLEEIQERIRDKEYLFISINVESLLLREEKDAYLFRIPRGRLGEDLSSAIRIKKSDCILLDEGQEVQKKSFVPDLVPGKTILYLLDEAQFVDADTPPKLDLRMEELAKKKPDHPVVKAYQRYRGGPDETIRSVIMTVNARMQPFDNEELLEIFSSNDIPLGVFGTGIDGDKKTKSKEQRASFIGSF